VNNGPPLAQTSAVPTYERNGRLKTLAMFPGQGSQYVGMGKTLLSEFPYTKLVFEEAEEASACQIRKLCFDGPESDLQLTANTQPCILTVSLAVWRVCQEEAGFRPDMFAGHSLGEYSALVAAGKLSLARAAFLVRQRGQAMQSAVPAGVGAMAAVLNLSAEDLEEHCKKISRDNHVVEPVNYNSPQQIVVAGHKNAVESLCASLTEKNVRTVILPVSAPFHSQLMRPAKEAMENLLNETEFSDNENPVIANISGQIVVDYDASCLIEQIDHPVRWTQSMTTAQESACERYVEVGPGKVLSGLGRRSLPKDVQLLHTEDLASILEKL